MEDDNILTIQTLQISELKTTIDILKDTTSNDVYFNFDKTGMKCKKMNGSKSAIVDINYNRFSLYNYNYPDDILKIGLNVSNLNKSIKTIDSSSSLKLYIKNTADEGEEIVEDDITKFMIESVSKGSGSIFTHGLDILAYVDSYEDIDYNLDNYTTCFKIQSKVFSKLIKNMVSLESEYVSFNITKNIVQLSCEDIIYDVKLLNKESDEFEDSIDFIKINLDDDDMISNTYNLKILHNYTKCSNLTDKVYIYIEQNKPLILHYDIPNLGTLNILFSENIKDQESDSEDEF
jgi:proliferating cell nuclear antigen PCNA